MGRTRNAVEKKSITQPADEKSAGCVSFSCFSGYNKKRNSFLKEFLQLGYKDSNLEMTESESVALPFGDSPMSHNKMYSTR